MNNLTKTVKELQAMQFITALQEFQEEAAEINRKNGFSTDDPLLDEFEKWFYLNVDPVHNGETVDKFRPLFAAFRNARIGLKLALIMGELGETLEAVRKNLGPDSHCPEFSCEEIEAADIGIRLVNYSTDRKLRLAEAMVAKQAFNRDRQDHSKEGRAAEHGKKF